MKRKAKKDRFRTGRPGVGIAIAVMAIAGLAVYLNSLGGEFLWDDIHFIKNNVYLRNWSYLPEIFTGDVAAGSGVRYSYYRPLTVFSYLIDYTIWGLNPAGYHLSSIFFHLLVAISVFFLADLLFRDRLLAFLTGLLYVVHPLSTETVAYISGRPDSLAALFMLLCFILYVKQLERPQIYRYILMIMSYLAALLSRENSVVLAPLLLLYHVAFKKRVKIREFAPLAGLVLIYVTCRVILLPPMEVPITLLQRIPGFFAAVTEYFRLLLLPLHLHQEYGMKLFSFSRPIVIGGMWLVGSLIIGGIISLLKNHKGRLVFFGFFWFFIALLPVSGIYPIKAYLAEHWLYLPSVGFYLLVAGGLSFLLRNRKIRTAAALASAGIILFYGAMTVAQNNYFRDPLTFYERTLRYSPDSARLHNNLGIKYFASGRIKEGMAQFEKAIELDPAYPDAYNNLGHACFTLERYDEALALFRKAIAINPQYADAYNNLGVLYNRLGKENEGLTFFKKAVALDPHDVDLIFNLGLAGYRLGKKTEAAASFRRVLQYNSSHAPAHHNLARIYAEEQEFDLARDHYRRARRLGHPPNPELEEVLKSGESKLYRTRKP